jgi:hypothetical protein
MERGICLTNPIKRIFLLFCFCAIVIGNLAAKAAPALAAAPDPTGAASKTPAVSGTLGISFLYMMQAVEPSFHTAAWLENEQGEIVKTLYVTYDLSSNLYNDGIICPDWAKKANWGKADKSEVDAVTHPTPNIGTSEISYDLTPLNLAPGVYEFCLQVHINENYNILNRGKITLGKGPAEAELEAFYSPEQLPGTDKMVRDVKAQYFP